MFFEIKFDLGTLDSDERSLPSGLFVHNLTTKIFTLTSPVPLHLEQYKLQLLKV